MTAVDFDGEAFFEALDARRRERGLSWQGVADALWAQSSELNATRDDHPISAATLTGIRRRGGTTCQHALFILRWLDRIPEDFVVGEPSVAGRALPPAGLDRRLRWHLHARPRRPVPGLFEALDEARRERGLTWSQAATEIDCTPSQLSGLRRARFAIGIGLALRITQWLGRPAADFVYAAGW